MTQENDQISDFPDDPMEAIRQEDAQRNADALETRLEELTGQSVNDEATGSPEGATTNNGATSEKTSATPRRAPYDEMVSALATSNLTPEQQETVRATLATNTRLQQEAAAMNRNLDTAVRQAVNQALAESQEPEPTPIDNITPEQRALFAQLADDLGYVNQTALQQKESASALQTYLDEARERAIQEHGDQFALRDESGNIIVPEEVQQRLLQTLEPIKQAGTLNSEDLFNLAYRKEQLAKEIQERGLEEGQARSTGRRVERQAARVESTTTTAPTAVNIRGPKGSKEDDRERVFARAALLAKQQLRRVV